MVQPAAILGRHWEMLQEYDFYGFQWKSNTEKAPVMESITGRPYLGCGFHRAVVALDENYVLKWALHTTGAHSNLAEADVYANAPLRLERLLSPVVSVATDGLWLVMGRASICDSLSDLRAVTRGIRACGWRGTGDMSESSVGRLDGRLVAVDYAELYPTR